MSDRFYSFARDFFGTSERSHTFQSTGRLRVKDDAPDTED